MKDICTDYCEAIDCTNCQYRNASKEERTKAYEELGKCRTFVCPLKCDASNVDFDLEDFMSDFKVVLPATTEEWQRDMNIAYNQALDDVDNIITEQLDKSDNQVECQTLRWVLDVLSDLIK